MWSCWQPAASPSRSVWSLRVAVAHWLITAAFVDLDLIGAKLAPQSFGELRREPLDPEPNPVRGNMHAVRNERDPPAPDLFSLSSDPSEEGLERCQVVLHAGDDAYRNTTAGRCMNLF